MRVVLELEDRYITEYGELRQPYMIRHDDLNSDLQQDRYEAM